MSDTHKRDHPARLPYGMRAQEVNPAKLTPRYPKQLELCKLTAGETVFCISDPTTRREYVTAAFAAAEDLGGGIYYVSENGRSPGEAAVRRCVKSPRYTSLMWRFDHTLTAQSRHRTGDLIRLSHCTSIAWAHTRWEIAPQLNSWEPLPPTSGARKPWAELGPPASFHA